MPNQPYRSIKHGIPPEIFNGQSAYGMIPEGAAGVGRNGSIVWWVVKFRSRQNGHPCRGEGRALDIE
jgi:hypothetical protein